MDNKLEFTRFPELDYAFKEAINTLCTNLTFVGEDKRIIEVTSCQPHEGKTFITLCMMRTLAQLGYKVVLVDLDLRRSQIAGQYGMQLVEGSGSGIAHYLAGMCPLVDILYETDIPNAYMIPVGKTVRNSLALLNTDRVGKMLRQLRDQFDFVLVDAAPIGAIIDAAEIAKSCYAVMFVVKYRQVGKRELQEAREQVLRAGCEVLGAVLNEVDMESLSSQKYYNKNYYVNYGSDYYKPISKKRKRSSKKAAAKAK